MKKKTRQKAQRGTVKKVLRCLRPYRFPAAASIVLSAVSVALSLYVPVLIGRAVDCIVGVGQVDLGAVVSILWRIGAVVAAGALMQWVIGVINNRITFHVVRDVRDKAFRKIQILPLRYLDAHPVGEIVSRVIADADQFADGLLLGFSQLFTGAATIVGTLGFMLALRPAIAAVVVLLTPMSFIAARFIATHTYRYFHDQSAIRAEQTALIDEVLTNQKVVQAFGRESASADRFDEVNGRLGKSALKAVFFSSLTNPTTRFVNNVVYALVALCGALVCIATAGTAAPFTVGSLSAFLAYANQYTKPFNEISGVVTEVQNALACASRLFELIDEQPQTPDDADAAVLGNVRGDVDLRNVAFSYVPESKLIENLNLSVQAGQRVAIVGPTGCGKTTIINLLMRFYDADAGTICVDGRNVQRVTRRSLRASYGMVLQETWLREGTVRENLTLGKPDATDTEIVRACALAHADGFIRRLPQGYDTLIGEDGGSLSQGQKQLLCIARMMLTKPPMLILDEATSSIDTRTEMHIQQAFRTMMQGRTSFVVAHRLSTIREADVILVMRDGRVVETGTHDDLLRRNGFYAELYNSQFAP